MTRIPAPIREQNILVRADGRSFLLDDGATRFVLDAEGRRNIPETTYYTYQTNQQFGTQTSGYSFQSRTIRLTVTYEAINRSSYHELVARLMNFIRPNQNRQLTLRNLRWEAGASPRVRDIDVRLTKSPLSDENTRGSHGFQDSIEFMADDPRYYDPAIQTLLVDDAITGGWGYPYGYPYGYGSGHLQGTVTYEGNMASHPIITITGPCSDCVIYHQTLGTSIRVLRQLLATDTLIINLTPGNIFIETLAGVNYLDATGQSDLIGFFVAPDSSEAPGGVNVFTFGASNYTSATTCSLAYYERYATL